MTLISEENKRAKFFGFGKRAKFFGFGKRADTDYDDGDYLGW